MVDRNAILDALPVACKRNKDLCRKACVERGVVGEKDWRGIAGDLTRTQRKGPSRQLQVR